MAESGRWSSGKPIDGSKVPHALSRDVADVFAPYLEQAYDDLNGGTWTARYRAVGLDRASGTVRFDLVEMLETMPPRPPQIDRIGEDVRLPMPTA